MPTRDELTAQIEAILDHEAFWNDGRDVGASTDKILTILDEALAAATPSKVYIVTSGYYSDYSIDAVFTDRATADIYAGTERHVEEFDLNTPASTARLYWPITVRGAAPHFPTLIEESPRFLNDGAEVPQSTIRIDSQPGQVGLTIRRYLDAISGDQVIEGHPTMGKLFSWTGSAYGRTPAQAHKIATDSIAKAQAEHLLDLERQAAED